MEMVHVLDHPLLQHKLSILRDETTGVRDFREIVGEIATLMCYDATRNLPLEPVEVQTPVAKAVTYQLAGKKLAIVPVLRAGLGMVEGILTLIPSAKVGHIGLFRDPETLEPVKYYCKMPTDIAERDVIILDPNEELQIDATANTITKRAVHVDDSIGWIEGRLIFSGHPLKDVANKLSRYYQVKINIHDEIANLQYTGMVDRETLPEALRMISATSPVKLSITNIDGEYFLSRAKRK